MLISGFDSLIASTGYPGYVSSNFTVCEPLELDCPEVQTGELEGREVRVVITELDDALALAQQILENIHKRLSS